MIETIIDCKEEGILFIHDIEDIKGISFDRSRRRIRINLYTTFNESAMSHVAHSISFQYKSDIHGSVIYDQIKEFQKRLIKQEKLKEIL